MSRSSKLDVESLVNDIVHNDDEPDVKKTKLEALQTLAVYKKSHNVWSKLGIAIPWIITAATLILNTATQYKLVEMQANTQFVLQEQQAENQLDLQKDLTEFQSNLQEQQARTQFQLQAAEMVANSSTPLEAQNKAHALYALFPDSLPDGFANASFNADNFSADSISAKRELINLIVEHPDQEERIRALWTEFIGVDITDVGSPDNASIGIVDFGGLADAIQQDESFYFELFSNNPMFRKFIEALIKNSDFQQMLAVSVLCEKQSQNQLTSEDIGLFVNVFGIPDSFNCPQQ